MRSSIPYCAYSGKPCYDKRAAVSARNLRYREAHVILRIYNCPECNWWHLTKKPYYPPKKKDHEL